MTKEELIQEALENAERLTPVWVMWYILHNYDDIDLEKALTDIVDIADDILTYFEKNDIRYL